ncbi:MAG: efflux RND transporter permease subunit, partial [Oscillospiraceae bacterium]
MAKFSVKKPLTVLVAVIAVLVMGVVSFVNMTPDLLPNIDMPYILLITAWPGATPEKVENAVTRPLEQAMATLEHIKEITSTSSANSSTLVLEFENSVNMDTVAVDILQKVEQLQGSWDDMVQTPYILKMNPSMIPVNVSAVRMEGMDTIALSTFVQDTLLNQLEGTAGVASISATGLINEKINIRLDDAKIVAANQKISRAIDDQFAEPEEELADGKAEIESNISDLEAKMAQLKEGADELAGKTAEGEATINQKQAELTQGKIQLLEQMTGLEGQLAELEGTEKQLTELQEQIAQLEATRQQLADSIPGLETLKTTLETLNAADAAFQLQIEEIQANPILTDEQKQQAVAAIQAMPEYQQTYAAIAEVEIQLAAMGIEGRDVEAVQALLDQA